MFARKVAARLKPNALSEFIDLVEGEILPWLRQQEGFLDLITLAVPDGSEVAIISFWNHAGNPQVHNLSGYPEGLETLGEILDSAPYVKTFEVVRSTFPRAALAQAENLAQETGPAQPAYRPYETRL